MADAETAETNFEATPAGNASRWAMEFSAARKEVEKWHNQGDNIEKRYLDERSGNGDMEWRQNLFSANINTLKAVMYGKLPGVSVTREYMDADDDVARVAGEMLERLLTGDIKRTEDGFGGAAQHALLDFLLPGLATMRARYDFKTKTNEVAPITHPETGEVQAEGYKEEVREDEEVETLYAHWKDQLWSPARIWEDVRWWAFKNQMSREGLVERFGKEVGKAVPLNSKRSKSDADLDSRKNDPWSRADVWEIWSKEDEKVYWYVEGYQQTLDEKEDPLGLEGFWPFPEPMMANLTNSKFIPRPDFVLCQDQYNEVDSLSTRIKLLMDAVRVAGVYDKTQSGLEALLKNTTGNVLVPVENWAMFGEKGGLRGVVDWFPLEAVVAALQTLRQARLEEKAALNEISGLSDIVRGQAESSTTATEQSIKAKFASVRLQDLQNRFARFVSDYQRIRGEIICKHFDAKTILERSNVLNTPDAQYAQAAVQLLKDKHSCYRIEVKPEAISLTDYASVKQERTEVIGAIAQFVQVAGPMAMQSPALGPMMLKVLQWMVAGLKGASEIEGVIDAAISQTQQAAQQAQAQPPQPPPPDPKLQAAQMKAQADIMKEHVKTQGSLATIQAQSQADLQHQENQTKYNILESSVKERQRTLGDIDSALGNAGPA